MKNGLKQQPIKSERTGVRFVGEFSELVCKCRSASHSSIANLAPTPLPSPPPLAHHAIHSSNTTSSSSLH
ncbi:hypothetical protein JZ751_003423 [Albula glossodonta]|uniref:Uncharacterized protein n=1 Tax=Albula glossodonta TaxID=121402 RepID=A0A8T2N7J8_9TELE|nr:hypothetical protein JZ751_003423 [Albula glossodonta]